MENPSLNTIQSYSNLGIFLRSHSPIRAVWWLWIKLRLLPNRELISIECITIGSESMPVNVNRNWIEEDEKKARGNLKSSIMYHYRRRCSAGMVRTHCKMLWRAFGDEATTNQSFHHCTHYSTSNKASIVFCFNLKIQKNATYFGRKHIEIRSKTVFSLNFTNLSLSH